MSQTRRLLLAWAGLLALLGAQIGLSFLHLGRLGPVAVLLVAAGMVALVGVAFMRLPSTVSLGRGFAIAAGVWLLILLGMGSLDRLTRTDYPAPVTRYP